jgi:hypothetical protein
MEIIIGFVLGIIVCRSNDKYKWFDKIWKNITNKVK